MKLTSGVVVGNIRLGPCVQSLCKIYFSLLIVLFLNLINYLRNGIKKKNQIKLLKKFQTDS